MSPSRTATAVTALAALALLGGCHTVGGPAGPRDDVGLSTPSAVTTAVFDCGRADLRSLRPAARRSRLAVADVCLRDALLRGQPARLVRVDGQGATTYQVTGRGEVAVTERTGTTERTRRCTGATGLFLLGRCSRDPGAAR